MQYAHGYLCFVRLVLSLACTAFTKDLVESVMGCADWHMGDGIPHVKDRIVQNRSMSAKSELKRFVLAPNTRQCASPCFACWHSRDASMWSMHMQMGVCRRKHWDGMSKMNMHMSFHLMH